jgi:D-glycero-D-manno-heptose 1,7-bisphosphate phosphatase
MSRRFVLIDRDGTLIVEKNYLSDPNQLEIIPGAPAALRRLQEAGWGVCMVTNQAGIARGLFDQSQLFRVHARLAEMLAEFDVRLDGVYFCPHGPDDGCDCRKPRPGLIMQAIAEHGFDPQQSFVVGDKDVDVGLGRAVGAKCILVRTGYGRRHEQFVVADYVVDDLPAAVDLILRAQR